VRARRSRGLVSGFVAGPYDQGMFHLLRRDRSQTLGPVGKTYQQHQLLRPLEADAWVVDPACSLYVLVRCPGLAVDIQRATCDGAFIRLHPLSSRTVWNSPPRRRVQVYGVTPR
jgi:hypothetical protein